MNGMWNKPQAKKKKGLSLYLVAKRVIKKLNCAISQCIFTNESGESTGEKLVTLNKQNKCNSAE